MERSDRHRGQNNGLGQWGLVVILLLVLQGCMGTPEARTSPATIGVVNFQRILEETHAGRQVTDSLNNFMKDRQALVELEQRELRRLENELLAQGSVLSPTARQQREEKFRRRMVQYQQKVADLNREVQDKQKELLEEFRSKVEEAVASLAQAKNLSIVVEYGRGTPTLYHQPSLDLTTEVIREVDRG